MGRRLREPGEPERLSDWRGWETIGCIIMIPFLPLLLIGVMIKEAWDGGWGLQLCIVAILFIAGYSALKPPFF